MLSLTVVLSAILYVHHASGQATTLYIPGFDPQPVTANLLGSQGGLTSYVIAPGVASADLDEPGFNGPATLVLGASTAAVTYIDETLGVAVYENCNIANGQAVCEDVGIAMGSGGLTTTDTFTESVVAFTVQGGGSASIQTSPVDTNFATWTGPPVDPTDTGSSGGTFPTATGSVASTSGSHAKTSSSASGSATPTSTGQGSGALNVHASSLSTLAAVGLVGVCAMLM